MSPELLDSNRFGLRHRRPSKESDCYALGMVILEVLTGQAPFPRHANLIVMQKILGDARPGRPKGAKGAWFTDDLWGMLRQCWAAQPGNRPGVDTVLECLVQVSRVWEPPTQQADEVRQVDEDECTGEGGETDEDGEMDEDRETDEDGETDEGVVDAPSHSEYESLSDIDEH